MLHQLVVENIALIQRLDLTFDAGLTVLTGETGAGKSIVIDALSLVLGARADTTLIRSGTERAMVQASLNLPPHHIALTWLREKSLDHADSLQHDTPHHHAEETLFLRRVLSANGRSRAFINETPVPLTTLAELGAMLVEIHGQQDHQTLLDPGTHLSILDHFAHHLPLVQELKADFDQWRTIMTARKTLLQQQADAADRRAFLAFQLDELESMDIQPGELAELEKQHARLTHVTQLAQAAQNALNLLLENAQPAASLTGQAAGELETVSPLDPLLEPIATSVRSLQYELDDAGERIRHYLHDLEIDPEQLETLDNRLDMIRRMARKHRREVEQLPALVQQWKQEMEHMDSAEEKEKDLDRAHAAIQDTYMKKAQQLGQSRHAATSRLNRAVEHQLKDLHMTHARFSAALRPRKNEPHASGLEDATFQVSPNPGEPLKPLHLTASGGELSRIMLALKTILAHALPVRTLIFDEVDTGVGGRVAASIGAKMAHIAQERQVLAITHLPQVAAWGKQHLKVEKNTRNQKTTVTITPLMTSARIEELARMLAGDQITPSARHNAQELLESSSGRVETATHTKETKVTGTTPETKTTSATKKTIRKKKTETTQATPVQTTKQTKSTERNKGDHEQTRTPESS